MSIVSKSSMDVLIPFYLADTHQEDAENSSFTTIETIFPEDMKSKRNIFNIVYMVCEVVVAVSAVFGNTLVIAAFKIEKKLRKRTNYYIVSLAAADFLVGLVGIPVAITAAIVVPNGNFACLFARCLLVVLCAISVFSLVAVSVDRYWAILHPMSYSSKVSTRLTIGIIISCWLVGTLLGILPLLGWNDIPKPKCHFTELMDFKYLVFLYMAGFVIPTVLLVAFYGRIYGVVLKQLRQISVMGPNNKNDPGGNRGSKNMLRILGTKQQREIKIAKKLAIIVIFFILCWIPLHTTNCIKVFCRNCYVEGSARNFFIILSHLNSAINPLLYAYHLKDFRTTFKNILGSCRRKPQQQRSMFHVSDDIIEESNVDSSHNVVKSTVSDRLIKTNAPIPSATAITSSTTAFSNS